MGGWIDGARRETILPVSIFEIRLGTKNIGTFGSFSKKQLWYISGLVYKLHRYQLSIDEGKFEIDR